ncbi:MAG TPA: carboxypeptidase regulatory-like domain-containing protein [Lysobacter sp.]
MDAQRILLGLLSFAVIAATARLLWFALRGTPGARPRAWRLALLALLQLASATLLYRTLLPPPVATGIDALVVATAHAPRDIARTLAAHEKLVALPEAAAIKDAEPVPDLGTALRRHPETARIRLVGDGLAARDRDHLRGMPATYQPTPLPRGIVELSAPSRVQAGTDFHVSGRVNGTPRAQVELLDPAGQRVDRQALDRNGRFELLGAVRTPGLVEFRVRLVDPGGRQTETAPVPLSVYSPPTVRVLVLAGAPDAELKYLRRWAVDAGVRMHAQIELGGGMQLGDAPVALNATTLKNFDAVIVDERTWGGMGAARRNALADAVRSGLGLLVRIDGSLSLASRSALAALGLRLNAANLPAVFKLPVTQENDDFSAARLGPGSPDAPTATTATVAALPELTRQPLRIDTPRANAWLRDSEGQPLAAWRALGRGRIGAWLPMDTFQLVLMGRDDLHAMLWSDAIASVARARTGNELPVPADTREGTRIALCGLADGATVTAAGGRPNPLLIDPATGTARCAGFWPAESGWHALSSGAASASFYVRGKNELPGVAAREMRDATSRVTLAASEVASTEATAPGSRWPWFLAWLLLSAVLWWLERSRLGRVVAAH